MSQQESDQDNLFTEINAFLAKKEDFKGQNIEGEIMSRRSFLRKTKQAGRIGLWVVVGGSFAGSIADVVAARFQMFDEVDKKLDEISPLENRLSNRIKEIKTTPDFLGGIEREQQISEERKRLRDMLISVYEQKYGDRNRRDLLVALVSGIPVFIKMLMKL